MTTVSSSKYLSPAFLRKLSLIPFLPTVILLIQFILIQFFNTEYNIKAILTLSLFSIIVFILSSYKKRSLQLPKNITKLYFIYFLISLISFYFSKTPNTGLAEITQDSASILLLFTIIGSIKSNTDKALFNLSKLNILIQTALTLVQVILLQNPRGFGSFMSFFDHRLVYPNALAFSLLISIFVIQDDKSKYKNIYTFLGLLALLFTFSRGALIAGTIGGILMLMLNYIKNKKSASNTFLISLVLSITSFLVINILFITNAQDITQKITFQGTEKITSVIERKQFFTLTPKLIFNHPLVGYGPNSFSYIFPTIQEIPLSNSQHPHNIFLKITIERGILSLLIFISIALITLHLIFKQKIHLTHTGLIIALTTAGLHSLIDYNLNLPLNTFLILLLLATIYQKEENTGEIRLIPYLITTSTFILMTVLTINHLTYKYPNLSPINQSSLNYKDSIIQSSHHTQNLSEKISLVKKHTELNPFDAFAFSNLGHLYAQEGNNEKAIDNFKQSIKLNPNNFWYPYAELTKVHKNITPNEVNKIITNLKKYQNAAAQNLHFTAQSDNINQAIQTAQNLINLNSTREIETELIQIILHLQSSQERFSSN